VHVPTLLQLNAIINLNFANKNKFLLPFKLWIYMTLDERSEPTKFLSLP